MKKYLASSKFIPSLYPIAESTQLQSVKEELEAERSDIHEELVPTN